MIIEKEENLPINYFWQPRSFPICLPESANSFVKYLHVNTDISLQNRRHCATLGSFDIFLPPQIRLNFISKNKKKKYRKKVPIEGRGVPPLLAKVFNLVLFLAPSQRYQNANNSVLAGSELIWKWFYYCFQNLELLPPQFENPWETNTSFFLHVGRNKINSGIQNDENRINREI